MQRELKDMAEIATLSSTDPAPDLEDVTVDMHVRNNGSVKVGSQVTPEAKQIEGQAPKAEQTETKSELQVSLDSPSSPLSDSVSTPVSYKKKGRVRALTFDARLRLSVTVDDEDLRSLCRRRRTLMCAIPPSVTPSKPPLFRSSDAHNPSSDPLSNPPMLKALSFPSPHNRIPVCQSVNGNPTDPCDASLIHGHIYLGCVKSAQDLEKLSQLNIGFVVNCTDNLAMPFDEAGGCQNSHGIEWDVKYIRLEVKDITGANIEQHFDRGIAFIEEAKNSKSNVLVHCQQGMSRSASLVIAWLMTHHHFSLDKAYWYCKAKRWCVSPNPTFMSQLKQLEVKLGIDEAYRQCSEDDEMPFIDVEAYSTGRYAGFWPESYLDETCTHMMWCNHKLDKVGKYNLISQFHGR